MFAVLGSCLPLESERQPIPLHHIIAGNLPTSSFQHTVMAGSGGQLPLEVLDLIAQQLIHDLDDQKISKYVLAIGKD